MKYTSNSTSIITQWLTAINHNILIYLENLLFDYQMPFKSLLNHSQEGCLNKGYKPIKFPRP